MKRLMLVTLAVVGLCVAAQPIAVHAQAKKAAAGKTMSAAGTVKSVSGTSLVVSSGGKDMTFSVDGTTKFVGKGLGTKAITSACRITTWAAPCTPPTCA